MNDTQNQNFQPGFSVLSFWGDLVSDSKFTNLSEDKRQKAVDEINGNIYLRIASALVEEDLKTLEDLNKNGKNPDAVKYFLLSKIPNLEKIVAEEIEAYKQENPQ